MAISEQEFQDVISRASYLMSPEGQQQINYAKQANSNNFDFDGNYTQPANSRGMSRNNMHMKTPTNNAGSKLPKVIAESLTNMPINYDEYGSVIDELNLSPKTKSNYQTTIQESYYNNYPQQNTPMPQQSYYNQPQYTPQPQQPFGIDYNYIRSIVNECVQNNLQQIKEELLKESNLKTIRLGKDNKIQLIDNGNNLFESKLEFKKNITKK